SLPYIPTGEPDRLRYRTQPTLSSPLRPRRAARPTAPLFETAVSWVASFGDPARDRAVSASLIFSQKSGDVRSAAERRKDMEAEIPALPFRIRERCARVTPKRLEASATVMSPR